MAATSPASVRAWRTTFLTLRDETLTSSPKSKSITELVHNLIFSQFESLLSAAPHLPPHEVTSDLLFLVELVANSSQHGPDPIAVVSRFSQLLHDICYRKGVPLRINSSSWTLIINSYATILQFLINKTGPRMPSSSVALTVKPAIECMETVRHIVNTYQHGCMPSDNIQLMSFLIGTIKCCGTQLTSSSHSTASQNFAVASWTTKYGSLWEVQTIAFTMLDDAFRRSGSSIPADIWQSTLEVLRKVMDSVASRSMLVEDHATSKFYVSLLNCLHTVLVDPKGPLHDHVSGFVATLRTFLNYGVTGKTFSSSCCKEKERTVVSSSLNLTETRNKDHAPYRPPHLRNKHFSTMERPRTQDPCSSGHEYSVSDFTSSDSDCSDSDGSGASTDSIRSFKVRIAAISCIQDLCQVDSKSFTTHWTMLLPTTDVLQPKKNEGTLMTCLLFDPCLKARIASASTLSVMLDGPSAVILQVAEYKETTKWGSFMALSSSLGQILMQLHMGVLHLIQHESHSRLLPLLLKILTLLISSTPYQRMPEELLPKVIRCLLARMGIGFTFKNDQTGLLVSTLNSLTAALSTSSSPQVKQMLSEEMSRGANEAKKSSGVLSTLFYHAEQFTSSPICFEALQGLRAVTHNYPMIAFACWDQISDMVSKVLVVVTPEVPRNAWKGAVGDGISYSGEKVITAAVKLLDECLRAVSGFKGTEENFDDKLIETPFLSDSIRTKKISSAPSYELESSKENGEEPKPCPTGNEYWFETIEKHISLLLRHVSPAVRAASVTCFAGITSSVFVSLPKDKQEFMISSMINAALHDGVHSVKSAACRAIGVISCFPQISRSAEILDKFIHAVVINTRDPLVSVRITASWALANICDSLRHCIDEFPLEKTTDSIANVRLMSFLTETALRLTNDGDKIKSNAVRALGNLSRFVRCTSSDLSVHNSEVSPRSNNLQKDQQYPSSSLPARTINLHLLERMVQAFLSCVTTGNVKVQWNVCHAMSNLFLNETIRLQEMDWAPSVFSILLLLLRDSSNYKIRIQAAAALAVPASGLDYGKSFSNVVQGLEHILENLDSVQNSAPSNFKYRDALQKQMTSTMLHVVILASSTDQQPLKDFLVKKASFLEEWLKVISSSLGETSSQQHESEDSREKQKRETISRAIQSLVEIYKSTNHYVIAKKLEKLDNSLLL